MPPVLPSRRVQAHCTASPVNTERAQAAAHVDEHGQLRGVHIGQQLHCRVLHALAQRAEHLRVRRALAGRAPAHTLCAPGRCGHAGALMC